MYIGGFRARQHLRSLALVMNDFFMISRDGWGLSLTCIFLLVEEKPQPGKLTLPGIEPGPARWEAKILLLDHRGSQEYLQSVEVYTVLLKKEIHNYLRKKDGTYFYRTRMSRLRMEIEKWHTLIGWRENASAQFIVLSNYTEVVSLAAALALIRILWRESTVMWRHPNSCVVMNIFCFPNYLLKITLKILGNI